MLSFLKIKNIALIDELNLEFSSGLNLLTGETGSGKSIIVDSLSALTGERVTSEIIKNGETEARIEGLFNIKLNEELNKIFDESGLEIEEEIIVRRELSATGKNRIFVNNQLVTQSFLRKIGTFLVDIHGQGEQATLFNQATHLEILDEYANLEDLREKVAEKYTEFAKIENDLKSLQDDESQKLQLLDILRFQVDEIKTVNPQVQEDEQLEEEKRRLNNVEKLSTLSDESYAMLYENEEATLTTLEKVIRRINELAEFETTFQDYGENLQTAQATLEDLAISVRNFRNSLEFSPERLDEIENRLAEISRLKRKYGGTIEGVLEHLKDSEERLSRIEDASLTEQELRKKLEKAKVEYVVVARRIHEKRVQFAKQFEKEVEANLKAVQLEKARFEVRLEADETNDKSFTSKGYDFVEFYFSANVGEVVKPIAKVASGGETSRLMLILNTTTKLAENGKTMVFDEIDTGIGGRVAEAVGLKLKELSKNQQVLCVTHQPQVASLAKHHFVVAKETIGNRTKVSIKELDENEKVEEIARMLAGEKITESARTHAREMIAANA
ncbi:MAG: DNA repair protein RecN [Pyrinomonadaceae bacterium]|jgi:DNA repair protein RecN (Recombination protein N)|nr:DNA repair protein RecN [Pyrinomonadaceae bacterium]